MKVVKRTNKESRNWSFDELEKMQKIVEEYGNKKHNFQTAADYFGVSKNAIQIRYKRYINKVHIKNLKKNTEKIPYVKIQPKGYKKNSFVKEAVTNHKKSNNDMYKSLGQILKVSQPNSVNIDLVENILTVIF